MKLIGLSGTNGSGKDTVGHMLAEKYDYLFVSGSDMLRDEARKRGLPVEREVLREISAEWRREHGLGVLIQKATEQFDGTLHKGLVIASLRNPGEADEVHVHSGVVVWVDADPKVRFRRITSNDRGRTEDNKTFEQFLSEERAEMKASGDSATLDMSGVKAKADIYIENNGDDIEAFKIQAEKALAGYL